MAAEAALLNQAAATPLTDARPFASLTVHEAADAAVLSAWAQLEASAAASIYQTRAWLMPWIETLGRAARLSPRFVLARAPDGAPRALLCLGLRRWGPFRVAAFLGGRDSNCNIGLFSPDTPWTPADLRRLLSQAGRAMGADALLLMNQPFRLAGGLNPLALLPHQPSPSAAFATDLAPQAEAVFAEKLSKDSRKKLRKKEARLAEMGALTYRIAASADERGQILDRFFEQRLERFRAQGIASDFEDPAMRAFIARASLPSPNGAAIELHALLCGTRIVAVYGGGAHQGQWSGMFNSFDADPEIAKSSPGDLLLMRVIAGQCAAGRTRFDLGIGEARYKAALCDEAVPLFDQAFAVTARGTVFVALKALALKTKRAIKQNERLFALVKRLRSLRRGRPAIAQAPEAPRS